MLTNHFIYGTFISLVGILFYPFIPHIYHILFLMPLLLYTIKKRIAFLCGIIIGYFLLTLHFFLLQGIHHPLNDADGRFTAEMIYQVSEFQSIWSIKSINSKKVPSYYYKNVLLRHPQGMHFDHHNTYQFDTKLQPFHDNMNEGGINRKKLLIANHSVYYTGKIKNAIKQSNTIDYISKIKQYITVKTNHLTNQALFLALFIGDTQHINTIEWEKLRISGLIHLVAISGLHISILYGVCFLFCFTVLHALSPNIYAKNINIAIVISLIILFLYTGFTGFALPTVRSLITLCFILCFFYSKFHYRAFDIVIRVLFIFLLFNPFTLLGYSLWLSFGAVFALLLINTLSPLSIKSSKVIYFVIIQFFLTALLNGITGLFMHTYSFHGVYNNLLILPYFSFIALPSIFALSIIGLIIPWLTEYCFIFIDYLLYPIIFATTLSQYLDQKFPILSGTISIQNTVLYMIFISLLIYTYFNQKKYRYILLSLYCFILLGILYFNEKKAWYVYILDVKQGLSIVIEKNHHFILYDTGDKIGQNFSFAQKSIIPFLKYKSAKQLDYLVISHNDRDHIGGEADIIAQFPIIKRMGYHGTPCSQHITKWQGLTLQWWQNEYATNKNDTSCVLRISDHKHSILLTGDIEKNSEERIIEEKITINSDYLISPHHGSLSSSSMLFLEAVQPKYIFISAGKNNRYHLPHKKTLHGYMKRQIPFYITGYTGQITLSFLPEEVHISTYRQHQYPAWYNQ